jgi:hypothetical protein
MVRTEVLVKLAAPDPWRFTVLDALRRKFGLAEVLDVDRIKSWELFYELESEAAALDITEGLLRDTVLLANPNRDVWAVRRAGKDLPRGFWCEADAEADAFVVKVTDVDDIVGASIESILRTRIGVEQISRVSLSTIWGLRVSRSGRDPRQLVEEVAMARSWRNGLLANPQYQWAGVYGAEEYLLEDK